MKKDDIYRIKLVESSSPLTTRPATPFRVAGLVVMQKEACYESTEISVSEALESKESELPVVKLFTMYCDMSLEEGYYEVEVGEWLEIPVKHGVNEGKLEGMVADSDTDGIVVNVTGTGIKVRPTTDGIFQIVITAMYSNGCLGCAELVTVSATKPEVPDEPMEPVEPEEPEVTEDPCITVKKTITHSSDMALSFSINDNLHGDKRDLFVRFEQLDGFEYFTVDEEDVDFGGTLEEYKEVTIPFNVHYSDGTVCSFEFNVEKEEPDNSDCDSVYMSVDLNSTDVTDFSLYAEMHGNKKDLFVKFEQLGGFENMELTNPTHPKFGGLIKKYDSVSIPFYAHYSDGSKCFFRYIYNGGQKELQIGEG